MSRILKRPMFRRGGSSNEGIMTGLVHRKGYQEDGFVTTVGQRAAALTPELEALLRQYTPKTRLPIGEFGLNIASMPPHATINDVWITPTHMRKPPTLLTGR